MHVIVCNDYSIKGFFVLFFWLLHCSGIEFLTSGGGSKAWRGMDTSADMTGLQFYYDGQGFMSISITGTTLSFQFYDALGNTLHGKTINKNFTS